MGKIKVFFKTFWKSISSPSYYKELISTDFSFTLKYLFSLLFLISLVGGIIFSARVIYYLPEIPDFIAQVKSTIKIFYPPELVVIITDGKVETNVNEPYFIDFPVGFGGAEEHFMAIDTKSDFESFEKYNTAVLITRDTIYYLDDPGYKVVPINQQTNYTFNKDVYDQFINRILPYLDHLSTAAYVLIISSLLIWPFLGAGFALAGRMIYLLFASVILWIIAKVARKDLTYGKVFQLSMHALSLPIILFTILGFFEVYISFIYTGILTVFMLIVISKFEKKPPMGQVLT